MGYEVSRRTKAKLEALLARGLSVGTPKTSTSGTARYDTHIKVTGDETSDGLYPCVPTYYDPVGAAWVEFGPALAVEENAGQLRSGRRYRAICYGRLGDKLVFAAGDALCDVALDLAGTAMDVEYDCPEESGSDDGGACCPKLTPLAGCHLLKNETGLHVDVDTLAGGADSGLEVEVAGCSEDGDCCPGLRVKAGCGIVVDGEGVSLDLPAIFGRGLGVEYDCESGEDVESDGPCCGKLRVSTCDALVPVITSIDSITISGTTITVHWTTTNYQLSVDSGRVCLEVDSTEAGEASVDLPCTSTDVVTGVSCNGDGTISVTTTTIHYVPCEGG